MCRAPTKTRWPGNSSRENHERTACLRVRAGVPAEEIMNAPLPAWPAITTPAQHFIGNHWHAPQGHAELPMIDPSDGAPFAAIARGNAADVDAAVRAAHDARDGAWGKLSPAERGRLLGKLSRQIVDHADELALTEARDCGKPLAQAPAAVPACARHFEF